MTVRDGLPEDATYRDDGCDLHRSCLTCPLPACRYEMPSGRARALSRAAALRRLLEDGMTMDEAAIALGVSRRTVYRLRRIIVPAPRAVVARAVMPLVTRREREREEPSMVADVTPARCADCGWQIVTVAGERRCPKCGPAFVAAVEPEAAPAPLDPPRPVAHCRDCGQPYDEPLQGYWLHGDGRATCYDAEACRRRREER